jgi:predicted acyltransferase
VTEATSLSEGGRLSSLDAFRGITIAGMILVNNPGSWRHVYSPLRHAEWHGWTLTDLVFPFFLFIVGVAMAFSFRRRVERGQSHARLLAQVVRRTIVLFLLGLIMYGFPDFRLIGPYILVIVGLSLLYADEPLFSFGATTPVRMRKIAAWITLLGGVVYFALDFGHFHETGLRVPGVLQRIAVCYLVAALIAMVWGVRGRAVWVVLLLVGYWLIVEYVPPPEGYTADVTGSEGLLHDWIDVQLLGRHLYGERPDPEGLLSTIPAVGTVLLGLLTGQWLQAARDRREKTIGLFFAANVGLVLALGVNQAFPINKKIWTSSYVVFTAALGAHVLAMCYWLIDVRGYRRWARPFVVYGTNAIAVYVASSLVAKMLYRWKIGAADGDTIAVRTWLYESLFVPWAGHLNGSLLFAIAYVVVWLALLVPLYRRRVFIKI